MSDSKNRKTCWLVTDSPTASSLLTPILENLGLETLSVYSMLSTSVTIDGLIETAANRADLVIGVIGRDRTTPNVYYELGYAAALRKRIVVFAPHGQPHAMDVARFPVVRIDLEDVSAVRFAVERALGSPKPGKPQIQVHEQNPSKFDGLADGFISRLGGIGDHATELERLIADVLRVGEGHRISDAPEGRKDLGYDFLLWSDTIQPYLGNPLPVEVKLRIRTLSDLDRTTKRLLAAAARSQAMWSLLVVRDLPDDYQENRSRYAGILIFKAVDLIARLRTNTLSAVLVDERNRLVHGVR